MHNETSVLYYINIAYLVLYPNLCKTWPREERIIEIVAFGEHDECGLFCRILKKDKRQCRPYMVVHRANGVWVSN